MKFDLIIKWNIMSIVEPGIHFTRQWLTFLLATKCFKKFLTDIVFLNSIASIYLQEMILSDLVVVSLSKKKSITVYETTKRL